MYSNLLTLLLLIPATPPIPSGPSERVVPTGSGDIKVHIYVPAEVQPKQLVLVFHGTLRNASEYRDWARPIADQLSAIVAAPEFDSKRFSSAAYHGGGLFSKDRVLQPKSKWTFHSVPEIAQAIKADLGQPNLPHSLIGHSAGGQFLHRLAAFSDPGAKVIVAANPGTLLFPTRDAKFSLGFGGLPDDISNDEAIKRYLAAPLVLYLGTADTATTKEQDEHLDVSPEAKKQGASRYDRGRALFRAAETLSKEKGWPIQWRVVEAPGIGHSAKEMFKHPRCLEALTKK